MKKNIILAIGASAILIGVALWFVQNKSQNPSVSVTSNQTVNVTQEPTTTPNPPEVPVAPPAVDVVKTTPTNPETLSATDASTGSISGTIRYVGAVPNMQKINMAADPKCVVNNTGNMMPEFLVVGEGQTLANVLVKITKGHEAIPTPLPTSPVVLDQKGCQYFPHVVGVQKDQPLKVLNSDGTLHNVHIMAQANGEHNEAMPSFRKELEKTFTEVESAFPVKCDVHPWMKAYVEVFDHPFFIATKPDGRYSIANLPAGNYEITFWHEKLGQQSTNVTVTAGQDVQSNVDWQAPQGTTKLDAVLLTNWN